ncbi:peptidoglycan D,D-transpeptidase FtsI family protein [Microcella sp.]|uniref:peptidoglycan D,D-transpeptidase FtsI family protein n=1 Tax=Microcella sp. TaxID=1913979 RepID=UPI00256CD06D|nr:penicillin-binding protein 2 [Microcella sp.]MBX9470466.1 penicillin-binding protein 2 [Microcella sp.]
MTAERRARRRVAAAVLVISMVLGGFVVRLVDIQVVRAEQLSDESEARRSIPSPLYGARGDIVDASGVVLADSVYRYDIAVSPRFVEDYRLADPETGEKTQHTVAEALASIAELIGADPLELRAGIDAELALDPADDHSYLARRVTTETFQAIRALRVPWVYFERQPSRTYPNGQVAGNLVGFLGTDGPQTGLEFRLNDCLEATHGSSTYERGADGVKLPGTTVVQQEAVDGGTLRLTIDADVQWFAQQTIAEQAMAIGADWATAWVVRVDDGHVIAAADWPTVDPNDVNGTAPENLGSRSFSEPFEPGSIFKAMTFAGLLDAGVTTPSEQLVVPGRLPTIANYSITDAWAHDDLRLTSTGVLMRSSNVGTSILSSRLSAQQRHDYLSAFGIGEQTAVDFLGESNGRLRSAESIDGHGTLTQMFGQGVTATSAQIASAYQALANGGVRQPLTLVTGCEHADGTVTHTPPTEGVRAVSEAAADTTVAMLESVATDSAIASLVSIPGYRVAAKTGTAEVAENGRYTDERIISVAGLAPADDPQFVVVVTYGRPDTMKTSATAAPTFRSIMTQVLKTFRVEPSTQPAPRLPITW